MLKDSLIPDVDLFLVKPLMLSQYQALIRRNICRAFAGVKAHPNAVQNLIAGMHHGDIQVWVGVSGKEERKLVGMLFTMVNTDHFLGTKKMVIYGLNLEAKLSPEAMKSAMAKLEAYAKSKDCYCVFAQTKVRGISKFLESCGYSSETTLWTKEI